MNVGGCDYHENAAIIVSGASINLNIADNRAAVRLKERKGSNLKALLSIKWKLLAPMVL